MMTQKFSRSEAIQFGWNAMKNNLGFFIVILIISGLILGGLDFATRLLQKEDNYNLYVILNIFWWILSIIIEMGLIKIALKFYDKQKNEFSNLFSCYPLLLKYLLSSILYTLIVLTGIIMLVIPGIIWAIKYQFYGYFIVDKNLGPIEALKKSSEITESAKWDLFVFGLLLGGINLLGALFLLVGLFATVPTAMVAMAFVYRKLLTQKEKIQALGPSAI